MPDSNLQRKQSEDTSLSVDEQKILDTALRESDQLLVRSLHDDQRHKHRRLWLSIFLIGGVVMSLTLIAVLAGWFAVASPAITSAEGGEPTALDEQWKARLLALEEGGGWFEGAKVGMELMRIPGDQPYNLLKENWPNIATSAKKQILKGFSPGMMGNRKMHPRFFDVMHLGMTDPDIGVREYAATYIEMQGLPNFTNKERIYARWWEKNKALSAKEIIPDKNIQFVGEAKSKVANEANSRQETPANAQ